MAEIETAEILILDLEEIRDVLAACVTYFTAEDVQVAQTRFGRMRPSPLTQELERVKGRVDGIFGDYLLARYNAEKGDQVEEGEEEDEVKEYPEEGQLVSNRDEAALGDAVLPRNPLGSPDFSPRIRGSQHA